MFRSETKLTFLWLRRPAKGRIQLLNLSLPNDYSIMKVRRNSSLWVLEECIVERLLAYTLHFRKRLFYNHWKTATFINRVCWIVRWYGVICIITSISVRLHLFLRFFISSFVGVNFTTTFYIFDSTWNNALFYDSYYPVFLTLFLKESITLFLVIKTLETLKKKSLKTKSTKLAPLDLYCMACMRINVISDW